MASNSPLVFALSLTSLVFACSVLLTGLTRRYVLRSGMLDIPNERSSHLIPTPRGGGLAIALIFLTATVGLAIAGKLAPHLALALVGGGMIVAAAGWWDDRVGVHIKWRFLLHFMAAVWALIFLGGMTSLQLGSMSIYWGYTGQLVLIIGVLWLINLYNFMDGIDGLAGGQAVCAGIGGGLLLWINNEYGLALLSFSLAFASAGFLVWNWPPAQIFMGDVGSGLLGFCFAILAMASEKSGAFPLLGWVILLAVFVFDASFTLLRRILRKEPWLQPHRSHAYQRAVLSGVTHRQVTTWVIVMNIVVLWPLAWLVWWRPQLLSWVVLAVAGLAWLIWMQIQRTARYSI